MVTFKEGILHPLDRNFTCIEPYDHAGEDCLCSLKAAFFMVGAIEVLMETVPFVFLSFGVGKV